MKMKKNKFLVSVAVIAALGGLTLASCDGQSSSNSADPSSETPVSNTAGMEGTAKLIRVTPPTEDVLIGDVLNLDDYIAVEGTGVASDAYEITITTPETATVVEGHTISITAEGKVSVRAVYGSLTAKFEVESMSALRSKFKSEMVNIGQNYFLDNMSVQQIGNSIYITLSGEGILHNEDYFAIYYDSESYGNSGLAEDELDKWGGMMRAGTGDTYAFLMDDLDGTNLTVYPGKQTSLEYYYLNASLSDYLSASYFTTKTDASYFGFSTEYLECTDSDVIANVLSYGFGAYSPARAGFTNSSMQIEYLEFDDGSEMKMLTFLCWGHPNYTQYTAENPALWTYGGLLEGDDYCSVKALEDYIIAGTYPEPLAYTELTDKVYAVAETKNYTLTADLYYSDSTGAEIEAPADTVGTYFLEDSSKTYVTENGIYSETVEEEGTGISAYVRHTDGKNYGVTNYSSTGALTDSLTATVLGTAYSGEIWGGAFDDLLIQSVADSAVLANFNVTYSGTEIDKVSGEEMQVFEFSGDYAAAFVLGMIGQIPGYGSTLASVYGQYGWTDYFTIDAYISSDSLRFDMYLLWESNVYYHIDMEYSHFGTTVLPEIPSDIFPAAAE